MWLKELIEMTTSDLATIIEQLGSVSLLFGLLAVGLSFYPAIRLWALSDRKTKVSFSLFFYKVSRRLIFVAFISILASVLLFILSRLFLALSSPDPRVDGQGVALVQNSGEVPQNASELFTWGNLVEFLLAAAFIFLFYRFFQTEFVQALFKRIPNKQLRNTVSFAAVLTVAYPSFTAFENLINIENIRFGIVDSEPKSDSIAKPDPPAPEPPEPEPETVVVPEPPAPEPPEPEPETVVVPDPPAPEPPEPEPGEKEPEIVPPKEFVVRFAFDSSKLNDEAKITIEDAVTHAISIGSDKISIIGHADSPGPDDYNLKLSERRAEEIEAAFNAVLEKRSLDPIKFVTSGKGESDLLVPDEERHPDNRRAVIIID